MWMVGYNEGGELNMGGGGADYEFSGRKLRPLMPRPSAACALLPSPNNHSSSSSSSPAFTRRIHAHDFLSQYHNLGASSVGLGDQQGGKRELMMNSPAAVVVSSSRWNPTPEQLRALEDLYRRGTRTPSADQIQQITAQLRRYGKIEGKNVFYWFQNHKARERQKRRRQMESAAAAEDPESLQKKDLGASRTVFEVEHTNNWPPSTNCTATLSPEESVSMQRAAECRTDGWVQFDEPELQQRRSFMERNATWHAMQLSCPLPLAAAAAPVSPHLINTPPNANRASSTSSPAPSCRSSYSSMDPKLFKTQHHHLTFFLSPHHAPTDNASVIHSQDDHNNCVQSQTLQLFPTSNMNNIADNSDPCDDNTLANQHQKQTSDLLSLQELNAPTQFFEFLPLKNSR